MCHIVLSMGIYALLALVGENVPLAWADFCHFPLGMQSGNIRDDQLKASTSQKGMEANYARLEKTNSWCGAANDKDRYFEVKFDQVMGITKIAMQGDVKNLNTIWSYSLRYSFDGERFFDVLDPITKEKMEFPGVTPDSEIISYEFTGIGVSARTLRLKILTFVPPYPCLRVEFYGCPYMCTSGLGFASGSQMPPGSSLIASSEQIQQAAHMGRLYSDREWCAFSSNKLQYFQIDLGKPMEISGIATQGSAFGDEWSKSYYVLFGDSPENLAYYQETGIKKELIGNIDRDTVNVNWFLPAFKARILRIMPNRWHRNICLRLEIIGCPNAFIAPLGLERHVLPNAQINSSSIRESKQIYAPYHARLNHFSSWCGDIMGYEGLGKEWISIDLGLIMVMTGYAIQGSAPPGTSYLPTLAIKYSFDGKNWEITKGETILDLMETFVGAKNSLAANPIVLMDMAITTRHVRFMGVELYGGDYQCARFELYGYQQYCAGSLGVKMGGVRPKGTTVSTSNGVITKITGRLYSKESWCIELNATNQHIQVEFNSSVIVTGILIQGSPKEDNWIKSFYVYFGKTKDNLTAIKENGIEKGFSSKGALETVSTIWLTEPIETNILRIQPIEFLPEHCLRFDITGCPNDCYEKLGLESGSLPDSAITASSSIGNTSLPEHSRLNTFRNAWMPCPQSAPSCAYGYRSTSSYTGWIQVCYQSLVTINAVIIQGGGDLTNGRLQKFSLLYSYSERGALYPYKRSFKTEIFSVRLSRYGSEQVNLPIALTAGCLKLNIESYIGREVGMRWETLGCNRPQIPSPKMKTEYSIVKGESLEISNKLHGQPGMMMEWTIGEQKLSTGRPYTLVKEDASDSQIAGSMVSKLHINSRYPLKLDKGSENCTLQDSKKKLYRCDLFYTSFAFYPHSNVKSQTTAVVKMDQVKGSVSQPKQLKAVNVTSTNATLNWDKPTEVGDFVLKEYSLQLFKEGIEDEKAVTTMKAHTFTGLQANTSYRVQVQYVNIMNITSAATSLNFTT